MQLDQITRRFEKLARDGMQCRIASGASPQAIEAAESRLGIQFPEQVRQFYAAIDGIELNHPPFKLLTLAEMKCRDALLDFCLCDHIHRLAFATNEINEAGQWFIVNADTGYRVTYTIASFLATRMWSWILQGRPIWLDVHGTSVAG